MATKTSRPADTGAAMDRQRSLFSPGVVSLAAVVGLVVLGVVGWVAWNQGAVVGLRWVEFDSPLTLAAFGFLAGVGAFFAPCAFALFPAYISYYLTAAGSSRESPARSLALGLTCAAGSVVFFALAAVAISLLGGVASRYLVAMKPAIAIAVIALGIGMIADVRLPAVTLALGGAGQRLPPLAGLFVYGFGYALATTGCTLPIYVSTVYTVRLVDTAGKPVTDARITLTARMADGMSAAAPLRSAGAPGTYRGEVLFTMEGRWDLIVRVARQAGRLEIPIREHVAR